MGKTIIEDAPHHPWTLGCRTCQQQAEVQLDAAVTALRAVWDDMRDVDKHHVPAGVLALVRAVIGEELNEHDPAAFPRKEHE
jgi:hypothetical protein